MAMEMERSNVQILFPFRFAICGPMNSGKEAFKYDTKKGVYHLQTKSL